MFDFSELKNEIDKKRGGNKKFFTFNFAKTCLSSLYDFNSHLNDTLQSFDDYKGNSIITLDESTLGHDGKTISGSISIRCDDLHKSKKINFIFEYPDKLYVTGNFSEQFEYNEPYNLPMQRELISVINKIALEVMTE